MLSMKYCISHRLQVRNFMTRRRNYKYALILLYRYVFHVVVLVSLLELCACLLFIGNYLLCNLSNVQYGTSMHVMKGIYVLPSTVSLCVFSPLFVCLLYVLILIFLSVCMHMRFILCCISQYSFRYNIVFIFSISVRCYLDSTQRCSEHAWL